MNNLNNVLRFLASRRPGIFSFLIAIHCFTPVYAAEPQAIAQLSEEDFLADIPVVLTATRLAQPVTEAPAAITIIDREMIRASGAREISELFRMVPGFVVSHDSGHVPIVSYHGLTTEYVARMQVLVDGRSVYSPVFGGSDWVNLPLAMDDIVRIEVIRGPNSASYGSNAFLSIINIITQHASETTGTFIRGTRGSNGAKDVVARYGAATSDFDYRVTASVNNDDGFEGRGDDRRMKTARFRVDYQANASDSLLFQAGVTQGLREIDSESLSSTEDRKVNLNFQQVKWQHQIDNTDALSLQFFHTLEDFDEVFDVTIPFFGHVVRDSSTRAERFDFELEHTKQIQENSRFVWGLGLRQDSGKGLQIFGTDPATGYTGNKEYFYNQMYRLFSNVEWRLRNNLTLDLGASVEKSDLTDRQFSPRLGIIYSLSPEQSLRFIASHATRSPSLNEADSNFRVPVEGIPSQPVSFVTTLWVGNDDLNPEEITSYEIGYHANIIRRKISFDLKLFHEELRELITSDQTNVPDPTDLYDGEYEIFGNLTDADINGIETNLEFYPLQDTRVIFSHSYSKIDSKNPNISSEKLAYSSPKHISSILAINRFPGGATGSILFYRVSESNGLGSGDPEKGYRHVNLRLGVPLRTAGMTGELAFVAQNITNEYIDWRDDNTAETQHYITFSAQWD